MARRVERRSFDVAIGTDLWCRSLAREELLAMTFQARFVFRKVGDIFTRNLVTGIARELVFSDVSGMREVGVIRPRLRKSQTDHYQCKKFKHPYYRIYSLRPK